MDVTVMLHGKKYEGKKIKYMPPGGIFRFRNLWFRMGTGGSLILQLSLDFSIPIGQRQVHYIDNIGNQYGLMPKFKIKANPFQQDQSGIQVFDLRKTK
jgi:hypothetical protein